MRIFRAALAASLFCSACASQPPFPSPLMERAIQARGGREALAQLKVVERSGTYTFHGLSPDAKGPYHTCVRYPDRAVIDIDAGPVQVHQVLGDFGPLECDGTFQRCTQAQGGVVEHLKQIAQVQNREELEANENIPGTEPIYKAAIQVGYRYKKDDHIWEEEYVPDTGLRRRVKDGANELHYADYRQAGNVLIPMRIEYYHDGQKSVTIILTSATHTDTASSWCAQRFSSKAD